MIFSCFFQDSPEIKVEEVFDENEKKEQEENNKEKTMKRAEKADETKLKNLIERRKVYGDITQNATEKEIEELLKVS